MKTQVNTNYRVCYGLWMGAIDYWQAAPLQRRLPACRGRHAADPAEIWRSNTGVEFAFVGLRGYGRRRWPEYFPAES